MELGDRVMVTQHIEGRIVKVSPVGKCALVVGELDGTGTWYPNFMIEPRTGFARETWHEDDGDVLWWALPVKEPPYVGTPLDEDFPDYMTHWTKLPPPPVALVPETQNTGT